MSTRSISANMGEQVTGIRYQMFDATGFITGLITAGITNPTAGIYYAAAANDTGALGVEWSNGDNTIFADEVFGPNGATAAEVWAYANRLLTGAQAAQLALIAVPITVISNVTEGNVITVKSRDSWSIPITGLGFITGATKLWFSVKTCDGDADSTSVIFLEESAGLTVVNSQPYTPTTDGTITVDDSDLGNITVAIAAAATGDTTSGSWAVKALQADGTAVTLSAGDFNVTTADIKAIS